MAHTVNWNAQGCKDVVRSLIGVLIGTPSETKVYNPTPVGTESRYSRNTNGGLRASRQWSATFPKVDFTLLWEEKWRSAIHKFRPDSRLVNSLGNPQISLHGALWRYINIDVRATHTWIPFHVTILSRERTQVTHIGRNMVPIQHLYKRVSLVRAAMLN